MRSFKHYIALVLMSLCYLTTYAHDFEVDGIYYNITSSSNLEVEVTHWGMWEPYENGSNTTSYSGEIEIPCKVLYNNREYTVVGIGDWAFGSWNTSYSGTNVTKIIMPESIRYIGSHAFYCCRNLTEVKFGSSLLNISQSAFGYTALKHVIIPDNVTTIELQAFYGSSLEYAILGKNLKKLGNDVFYNCSNLKEVYYLGENKPQFGQSVFYHCHPALEQYLVRAYISFKKNAFTYTGSTPTTSWSNGLNHLSCSLEFPDMSKDVGNYDTLCKAIFSGSANFTCEIPYSYTINKAPINISVEDNSRCYGDENPSAKYSVTGMVNGETMAGIGANVEISCTATTKSDVGTYSYTATTDAKNYIIEQTSGVLTVTQAPIIAIVNNSEKVYGETNPNFSCNYEGMKNGEAEPQFTKPIIYTTSATQESGAGRYSVTADGAECKNYKVTQYNKGYLTINKAPLTVKPLDTQRLYGEENPNIKIEYSGFRLGDNENAIDETPVAATTATKKSDAGKYPINIEGGSSTNYEFEKQTGTLTINKRVVTAKARNYTRKYNEKNPKFEIDYEGFVNDDDKSVILAPLVARCSAVNGTDVGVYDITLSGGEADNYNFEYVSGQLTIEQAEQTITWEQEFTNAQIGDQIAINATVDSDLELTVTTDNGEVADIYWAGKTCYIDCLKDGVAHIRVQQLGNKNYAATTRITKTLTVGGNATGISRTGSDNLCVDKYYNLNGQRTSSSAKGIIIKNGKKIFVK